MRASKAQVDSKALCLECGLCCDGTIFADVVLLREEPAAELLQCGMPLVRTKVPCLQNGKKEAAWRFMQPCAAFDGCRCKLYEHRPSHCRQFECLLLKAVQDRTVLTSVALGRIRKAKRQARRLLSLLRALGNDEENLALADRFRRTVQELESRPWEVKTADLLSNLTLAFHELNLTVQRYFYPAPGWT